MPLPHARTRDRIGAGHKYAEIIGRERAIFTKIFPAPYYGLDMNERLKTGLILQFFQEAAALHAHSVGIGVSDLLKRNFTWVLRRYRIEFYDLPGLGDVTVKTWFEPHRNLVSVRLFEAKSGDSLIAKAWSGWIVIDLARGRPVRLDRALPAEYYDNASSAEPGAIEDVERAADALGSEKTFAVRWSELDLNGHTNHTVYFDWAVESLPDDIVRGRPPALFDAEYVASVPKGAVTVRTREISSSPLKFAHSIILNASGAEAARLSTSWGKARA
jgi:acyl-ACP thioesterase